jgi:hypothetical protein
MTAAIASARQSFEKLKALVEEIGREWTSPPVVMPASDFSALDPRNAKARRKDGCWVVTEQKIHLRTQGGVLCRLGRVAEFRRPYAGTYQGATRRGQR